MKNILTVLPHYNSMTIMGIDKNRRLAISVIGEPMAEFSSAGRNSYGLSFSGDAVNVATSAARLGLKACVISAAGDDSFGRELMKYLESEDIGTEGMTVVKGGFTGLYFISLGKNGKHEFTYYRKHSAASSMHITGKQLDAIRDSSIFHFSGIAQAIGSESGKSVSVALNAAVRAGCFISYDVNFRPALWTRKNAIRALESVASRTDLIFISSEDYSLMFGKESVSAVIERMSVMGASNIIYKCGGSGSIADFDGKLAKQKAFHVKAIDATGAGDAFDAGFLAHYYRTGDAKRAMEFASVNAALKCLKKGGTRGLPHVDMVTMAIRSGRRKKMRPGGDQAAGMGRAV